MLKLTRWGGLLALVGALFQFLVTFPGTVVSYWTDRGFASDPALGLGISRFWAPSAAEILKPILFFDRPGTVYHMYDGLWMIPVPLLLAGLVALFHARRKQGVRFGRFEWAAYLVTSLGLTLLLVGNGSEAWFSSLDWFGITDFVFIFLTLPGLLLTLAGSSLLGAALLRQGGVPRAAAWLLVVGGFPGGALVGLFGIGHLFGFLLLYDAAWIILGAYLWRERDMYAERPTTVEAVGAERSLSL